MDRLNQGLFAFAAYNAGPAHVAGLRKKAEELGLNRTYGSTTSRSLPLVKLDERRSTTSAISLSTTQPISLSSNRRLNENKRSRKRIQREARLEMKTERLERRIESDNVARQRLLREVCELLDSLTREFPLLLSLPDLHWADFVKRKSTWPGKVILFKIRVGKVDTVKIESLTAV